MNWIALLTNILRRPERVSLTSDQIDALASDADAFEEKFGWTDPRIVEDK
jgi:hypothetical protein